MLVDKGEYGQHQPLSYHLDPQMSLSYIYAGHILSTAFKFFTSASPTATGVKGERAGLPPKIVYGCVLEHNNDKTGRGSATRSFSCQL